MKKVTLELPLFGSIVGTRALLGLGAGLLLAGRMRNQRRLAIGRVCLAAGIASTVPALVAISRRLSD